MWLDRRLAVVLGASLLGAFLVPPVFDRLPGARAEIPMAIESRRPVIATAQRTPGYVEDEVDWKSSGRLDRTTRSARGGEDRGAVLPTQGAVDQSRAIATVLRASGRVEDEGGE